MIFKTVLAAILVASTASAASAQGIRCSAFLHNRDGSWSSFDSGTVLGPKGPIEIKAGERLNRGQSGGRGEVADALDHLCEGD